MGQVGVYHFMDMLEGGGVTEIVHLLQEVVQDGSWAEGGAGTDSAAQL